MVIAGDVAWKAHRQSCRIKEPKYKRAKQHYLACLFCSSICSSGRCSELTNCTWRYEIWRVFIETSFQVSVLAFVDR